MSKPIETILQYLKDEFGATHVRILDSKYLAITGFLQDDYGEDQDCTITSIATVAKYFEATVNQNPAMPFENIYDVTAGFAQNHFSHTRGTNPLAISSILNQTLQKMGLSMTAKGRYGKNVGYNMDTVRTSIYKKRPLILSLHRDGRNYYSDHTVTVMGYSICEVQTPRGVLKKSFLRVLDNWSTKPRWIDYEKLSIISSVNIIK